MTTAIEWCLNPDGTPGQTWNPITGCLGGCSYCYARRLANTRLKHIYLKNRDVAPDNGYHFHKFEDGFVDSRYDNPFYPRSWPEKIHIPDSKKRRGIFPVDMGDLFGIGIPQKWTWDVLKEIKMHPHDRFYLLTKQPQNMLKYSPFPANCYVGVSWVCDNESRPLRFVADIEATIKFISFEPLLDFGTWWNSDNLSKSFQKAGISWVIIGCETKNGKPVKEHLPKIEWIKEIVDAADKAGAKVFLKNNLFYLLHGADGSFFLPAWAADENGLRQEMPVDGAGGISPSEINDDYHIPDLREILEDPK
jgi:protein gp37